MLEINLFSSYDRQKKDDLRRLKLQTKETARKNRWKSFGDFAVSFYHNPRDALSPLIIAGLIGLNGYTFVQYRDLKNSKDSQSSAVSTPSPVAPPSSDSVSQIQSDNPANPVVQNVLASESQLREERERVFSRTINAYRIYGELQNCLDERVAHNREMLETMTVEEKERIVSQTDMAHYNRLRREMFDSLARIAVQNYDDPELLQSLLVEEKSVFERRIAEYYGLGPLEIMRIEREVLPADYNDRIIALQEDHVKTLRLRELYRRQMGLLLDAQVSLEARLESRVVDNQRRLSELSAAERLAAYAQNDNNAYLRLRADIARVFSAVSSEFGGTEEFNRMLDERVAPLMDRVGNYEGLGNVRIESANQPQNNSARQPPAVEPQNQPQRTYSPRVQRELDDLRRRLEYTEAQRSAGRLNERAYERMRDSIQERIRVLESGN